MNLTTQRTSKMNSNLRISDKGLELVKVSEGCRLTAYPDPGTGGAPWTVGYGSTGPTVYPGRKVTLEEAEQLLRDDLGSAEKSVRNLVRVALTQGQFDALVSFTFNCGAGNLAESTLLRRVNKNQMGDAAKEFKRWDKAAGRVLPGLTKRRAAEAQLFLGAA